MFGVDIDLQVIWQNLVLLAIAYVLALPVAMNRERQARSAGLRTFPLVAIAACGYMLVGTSVFADARAQARILEGLVTGIGFIGGGAILKSRGSVSGTATAASIWNTGAIGVAVAYGRFEIAILLSTINFITLRYVSKFKSKPDEG
ncbi:MAG TPA: MgtC/SapB family protein [Woeseiaceae bacterium]|nr:MgtC/SapB family protein [Woeseiaceae bacterium]